MPASFAELLNSNNRRPMMRPKNPADKCTIVSVHPDPIFDYKPTVIPAEHVIEGAKDNDFSILVVGGASWFKEMEEGQPSLEIPIGSEEVAKAFIRDNVISQLGYIPNQAMPGLFYVYGAYTKESILKYKDPVSGETFAELLGAARQRQRAWYEEIVKLADINWAQSNNSPRSISRDARMAAKQLGLKNKPWMGDFIEMEKTNCPACGFMINPVYPVCSNCKAVINPERAKSLNLQFAS